MFRKHEDINTILFTFSSSFEFVDRAVDDFEAYLKRLLVGSAFEIKLVMRELLINAVEHGNQKDSAKIVKCDIYHLGKHRFRIEVTDQGDGFDYCSLKTEMPIDPLQDRNRGYALIHAFSRKIEFNDSGNHIIAYVECKS